MHKLCERHNTKEEDLCLVLSSLYSHLYSQLLYMSSFSLPQVPRTARSLCASKDCLFLLCCHDIAEPPLFRCPPPVKEEEESEVARDERERLIWQLSQLRECESLRRKVDILRWAVQRHMTINPAHREFLVQALIAIRPVSDGPSGQS